MNHILANMLRPTTAGLLLLLAAPSGWAQSPSATQPMGGLSMTTTESVDGRITSVDTKARVVSVALSNGRTVTGTVSELVGGLETVKVGGGVHAVFEETVSFVLSGPNTATPTNRAVAGMAASGPGQLPAGAMGSHSVSTWLVVSTDVAGNTISLVEPAGGQVLTFHVRTPEGRAALPRIKPGDRLTVVHTEFVFAGVTRTSQ